MVNNCLGVVYAHCSVTKYFPEKMRWCSIENVCLGVEFNCALCNADHWILRYIRTYLSIDSEQLGSYTRNTINICRQRYHDERM